MCKLWLTTCWTLDRARIFGCKFCFWLSENYNYSLLPHFSWLSRWKTSAISLAEQCGSVLLMRKQKGLLFGNQATSCLLKLQHTGMLVNQMTTMTLGIKTVLVCIVKCQMEWLIDNAIMRWHTSAKEDQVFVTGAPILLVVSHLC